METAEDGALTRCKFCEHDIRQNSDFIRCWICNVATHTNCAMRNVTKTVTRTIKAHMHLVQYACTECRLDIAEFNTKRATIEVRERELEQRTEARNKLNEELIISAQEVSAHCKKLQNKLDEQTKITVRLKEEYNSIHQQLIASIRDKMQDKETILELKSKLPTNYSVRKTTNWSTQTDEMKDVNHSTLEVTQEADCLIDTLRTEIRQVFNEASLFHENIKKTHSEI